MSLRTFIQHNFWPKLFSLLLATLIWFAIHFWIAAGLRQPENPVTNPMVREFFRQPVLVTTKPGDSRIFKVDPEDVFVLVTGEAAVLRDLSLDAISVYVDMSNDRSLRETNQQVKLDVPNGVTVINVAPRAVNVEQIIE